MKNAVYFQSGGPTSVINASFYGVIKEAKLHEDKIDHLYGARYGLEGLINGDLVEINKPLSEYEELKTIPGAILGSARLQLKENDPRYEQILNTIKKYSISYVFVNGGNDSMDTADKLNKYFSNNHIDCKVVGIPKTIDNDLVLTDHTPGFGSAVKYVVRSVSEVALDTNSYKKGRVTICEIMGRDAGWLASSSTLASLFDLGPDLVYLPEVPFSKEEFLLDVKRIYEKKGKVLVCVSEALKDKDGKYISAENELDSFGHVQLGSIGAYLDNLVKDKLGIGTRHLEFSLLQRAASHIQSSVDQDEAIKCGRFAVESALNSKVGMVSIKRISNNPYQVEYELVPLSEVANGIKHMPLSMINKNGEGLNQELVDYLRPFIDEEEIKVTISKMFIGK